MYAYAGDTLYESLVPGAGHNIRGDRATRDRYLDVHTDFLTHQPDTTLELQS